MSEPLSAPLGTVYVPTLLAGPPLEACLRALKEQTVPIQVVVADNGSGSGCAEMIESSFPWVERVGFGENLGFGPALNRAVSAAGSGPIIFLNDDAVAGPGFVETLISKGEDAEMVAGVMISAENEGIIDSAGVIVDQTLMAFDYLSGEPVASLQDRPDPTAPTGGGALFSRAAFEAVGGFDEKIFLYYEDVDLGLRIRSQGGRCRLAPSALAAHAYSGTLGARNPRKYSMTGWSRGYLMRRYGVAGTLLNIPGLAVRESVICAGQLLRDHTTAGARGRLKGWRDAKGLSQRSLPPGAVTRMSALAALRRQLRRN